MFTQGMGEGLAQEGDHSFLTFLYPVETHVDEDVRAGTLDTITTHIHTHTHSMK